MFEELYEKFFNSLGENGFKAITKIAYEYFQKPITVVDIGYKLLCQIPDHHVSDIVFDSILDTQEIPTDTIGLLEDGKYRDYLFKNRKASYVDWGSLNNPRIMGAVEVNHQPAGYFAILCLDAHCSQEDLKAAEVFRLALGIKMGNYQRDMLGSNELGNVFMRELVNERVKSKNSVLFWCKYCPDLLKGPYLFVYARGIDAVETIDLQQICRIIKKNYSYYFTSIRENTLSILFYNINAVNPGLEKEFIKNISHWFKANSMHCGLSMLFHDIMDIDSYRYMAEDALELPISAIDNKSVKPFEEYALNCMVQKIKTAQYWRVYLHPYLTLLKDYDAKYRTDYLNTLKIYLLTFKDLLDSSTALGIQRNSLKYRLQKINEITGINYFDNKLCAQLLINFYMMEE